MVVVVVVVVITMMHSEMWTYQLHILLNLISDAINLFYIP
jgi:hypothetical protein